MKGSHHYHEPAKRWYVSLYWDGKKNKVWKYNGDAAFKNGRPKPEDVLPDETTTLTNEAGQVPGLTV